METANAGFTLSCLGFGERESLALQAVLALSEQALSVAWRFQQDFHAADAVLVQLDTAEGGQFWETGLREFPALNFVACSAQDIPEARWRLDVPANGMPSRKAFIDLLNRLSEHLASTTPGGQGEPDTAQADAPVPTAAASPAADSETARPGQGGGPLVFEPRRHLLGLLQATIAADRDLLFALPGRGAWLLASPKNQRYYSAAPIGELQALLLADADDIQTRALPVEKALASPLGKDLSYRPLAELLWQAALASSGGRLLAGCGPGDVVRLKHWPPVTHLPSFREFLRVAAFMNHNAASLETIAEHTAEPLEKIFDFHNACDALGLLERHEQAAMARQSGSEPQKKELYRRISSRLARAKPGDAESPA